MKKQKMSLEKMKNVLSNVLTRDEMKEVLAGSGGGPGSCGSPWVCPTGPPYGCVWVPAYNSCRCVENHGQICA